MAYKFKEFVQPYADQLRAESANTLNERFLNYFKTDTELDTYLADLQSATFDADQEQANSMRTKYRSSLDDRVARGDYENLGGAVMMDARNFVKEYTPLEKNLTTQQEFKNELKKQVADGKISNETAALSMQKDIYTYNQDALSKGIHQYVPGTVVEDIPNLVKYFEDNYLDGYIKRNYSTDSSYYTEDGVYKVRKKDGVSDYIPDEDLSSMYNNMLSDPKVQSYLSQYADLRTFNLSEEALKENQQQTIGALGDGFYQMQNKYSTMRPTAERKALKAQMDEVQQTLDSISNATPDEYKSIVQQGLIQEVLSPAEQIINTKYAGVRKTESIYEQTYSPLYLKKVESDLEIAKGINEYLDLASRSQGEGDVGLLQTTVSDELASEENLDKLFKDSYTDLRTTLEDFNKEFEGMRGPSEGELLTDTEFSTPDEITKNSLKHLETIMSEDPTKIEDPQKRQRLEELQELAANQYNNITVTGALNKEFSAIEDQIEEEFILRDTELGKIIELGNLAADSPLYKTGKNAEASASDIQNVFKQSLMGLGNGLDVYVLNDDGINVSKISPNGKIEENLSVQDIPEHSKEEVIRPGLEGGNFSYIDYGLDYVGLGDSEPKNKKPTTTSIIIPGISTATSGDNLIKSQNNTLNNAPNLTEAFNGIFNELHKGDFYGKGVSYSPNAVTQMYNEQVIGRSGERRKELEENVEERTSMRQKEFITDFTTKGTYLGGLESLMPPSTTKDGLKGALSNTKEYLKYFKTPSPNQRGYQLFDPKLDTEILDYQLFAERNEKGVLEFNASLVDDEGNKKRPPNLGEIFGIDASTGKVNAFLIEDSFRSEVQIPPLNKRGLSVVYQEKVGKNKPAGKKVRMFIPYENLPAKLPQIKERLENPGAQVLAQYWSNAQRLGRDLDLVLNPSLMTKPLEFESDDKNYIFAGQVRFSPRDGKVYYLDINSNPIPNSEKDYNEWFSTLGPNELNIVNKYFNK